MGALFLLLALAAVYFQVRKPSSTPFLRGQHLAQKQGCFACHGPGGVSGSQNPGAESDIPSWDGGSAMMYLEKEDHIREYIELGHRKDKDPKQIAGLVRMPAYHGSFSQHEMDDLVAYVKGVSAFYPGMPDSARIGMETAKKSGCLGCHGESGRGGIHNPGSFKGIIPGWDDPQLADLTRNDAETEEWIRTGTLKRLGSNRIARHFLHAQRLSMPAYDTLLTVQQIRDISRFINWLRSDREI